MKCSSAWSRWWHRIYLHQMLTGWFIFVEIQPYQKLSIIFSSTSMCWHRGHIHNHRFWPTDFPVITDNSKRDILKLFTLKCIRMHINACSILFVFHIWRGYSPLSIWFDNTLCIHYVDFILSKHSKMSITYLDGRRDTVPHFAPHISQRATCLTVVAICSRTVYLSLCVQHLIMLHYVSVHYPQNIVLYILECIKRVCSVYTAIPLKNHFLCQMKWFFIEPLMNPLIIPKWFYI